MWDFFFFCVCVFFSGGRVRFLLLLFRLSASLLLFASSAFCFCFPLVCFSACCFVLVCFPWSACFCLCFCLSAFPHLCPEPCFSSPVFVFVSASTHSYKWHPALSLTKLIFAQQFSTLFRAVCSLFSNSLVPFEQFAPYSQISLVHFERFAPCSPIRYSLSSGLLPVLEFPSHFRAPCSLFSNSLVSFERSTPCSQTLYSLSIGLLPVLKFPNPFRAVCASQVLQSLSSGLVFLPSFEQFAPCSQIR